MLPFGNFITAYEAKLFNERYKNGDEQDWDGVMDRVIMTVRDGTGASAEDASAWSSAFKAGTVVPGSPQLWNYGATKRYNRNGSSCFTGEIGDRLEDFRQADADAEAVYVASGGFGILLDSVRPRGCKIKHCSEGAMGSMCFGGPARRIEGTTGYITGSGRARGALMMQMGDRHPDLLEFMLAKRPTVLGWLDDWPIHAKSRASDRSASFIDWFSREFLFDKDWPTEAEMEARAPSSSQVYEYHELLAVDLLVIDSMGRVVPHVFDPATDSNRPANRDWDLPMQNCNMSVRFSDKFMESVERGDTWAFVWRSKEMCGPDEISWIKTDALGEGLKEYDGKSCGQTGEIDHEPWRAPRYAVCITTWEGLRANLAPNTNHWRDTDYARFYRTKILPAIKDYHGKILASQLWDIQVDNAWNHADPGAVFSSTYERFQPIDSRIYGERLSNPCAEFVCSPGGSCNLVSVNLRACISTEVELPYSGVMEFQDDWEVVSKTEAFEKYIANVKANASIAMAYISHAMEHNIAPVKFIHEMSSEHYRTVGVGIMGLFEAMAHFHVKYGSVASDRFAAYTMSEVALACWDGSFDFAKKSGKTPKAWNKLRSAAIFGARADFAVERGFDDHFERWNRLAERVEAGEVPSHTCVTSVAPTGTISMIAGWQMTRESIRRGDPRYVTVTSGVEPPMGFGLMRQDNSGISETSHDMWMDGHHNGKEWMVTAMDGVTPEGHILVQAAICDFTCMSVSKTVNLSEDASRDDVSNAYFLAWKLGIPGTSIYRNKSKPMQVLTSLDCPSGECKVDYDKIAAEATAEAQQSAK